MMEKTFKDFMARRYAEAEEYASGVTRAQADIAEEAWELATLAEREACAKECEDLSVEFLTMAPGSGTAMYDHNSDGAIQCAEAIRERSNALAQGPGSSSPGPAGAMGSAALVEQGEKQ